MSIVSSAIIGSLMGGGGSGSGGGTVGPPGPQGPPGERGPIGLNFRGPFQLGETYNFADAVQHNGSTYYYIFEEPLEGAIVAPSPETGWLLMAAAGQDGQNGQDGEPREPATLADLQAGVNTSRFINPAVASAWRDAANGVVGLDANHRAFFGSPPESIPSELPMPYGGLLLNGGGSLSAGGDNFYPILSLLRWSNDKNSPEIRIYKARNTGGKDNIFSVAASDSLFSLGVYAYTGSFIERSALIQVSIPGGASIADDAIPEGALYLRVADGTSTSGPPQRGVIVSSKAFQPFMDNVTSLGYPTQRFTDAYVTSGTIQTSDARAKAIVDFPEEILDVWAEISPVFYQLNDSIETKGQSEARVHAGYIAQAIKEAFAAAGLDAHQYGFFCYDEWAAEPEQKDDDGQVIQAASPAGNRYSLRYEQCAVIEAAYQRRRAGRLEARLAAVEERLAALEAKLEQF